MTQFTTYLPYLHKRWKAGCQNGLQLWRELRAQGYTGSASTVKPYIALLRQVPEDLLPPAFARKAKPAPQVTFSVRRLIWLALSRPEKRTAEQNQEVAHACSLSAQVTATLTLAQGFVSMLREKRVKDLAAWLQSAQASPQQELRQFAKSGLRGTARRWKRPSPDQKAMGKPKGMDPLKADQARDVWPSEV